MARVNCPLPMLAAVVVAFLGGGQRVQDQMVSSVTLDNPSGGSVTQPGPPPVTTYWVRQPAVSKASLLRSGRTATSW
jgi:hypothetical protein